MADTPLAFVRKDFIEPSPPPVTETGLIKWLRENLFSSTPNTILTLVSLYVVYAALSAALPWFLNGVWTADSLRDCRDQLNGATGACFAVLVERWHQMVFGITYPTELYWRPLTAFVLLFVAGAPVLYTKLPRVLLIGTLVYPFLAYWLVWGGTAWIPLLVLGGLLAGYAIYTTLVTQSFAAGFLGGIAAAIVVWSLTPAIAGVLTGVADIGIEAVPSREIGGFMLNLILGVVCLSLSLPLGIALALGRQSSMPIIKYICVVFIEFIRGVPLITLLFVANVVLAYFLPPGSNFDLILRVIIMITFFASAYIAEVIRGGLAALPRGQYEAADALGLDYAQSMRLIILPQALKISIPGIVNVAVGLFKDTTLVSVISMFDLVGAIRGPILSSADWNGIYWEAFGFAALLFFVSCFGISKYSQWLERQLQTDHR